MRSDALDPADFAASLPTPGVGTRAQWIAAGAPHAMFRDGRLLPVTRGLYCLPAATPSPIELLELFRPALPADATLVGWAAALLHGVRDSGPSMRSVHPEPIQLAIPRAKHSGPPGCATLRMDLPADDITTTNGFTLTNAARTAYDMVRFSASTSQAVSLADCFMHELNPLPVRPDDVLGFAASFPNRRGNPLVRHAVAHASPRTRSIPESIVRHLLISELHVPASMILVNVSVVLHGVVVAELDLLDLTSGNGFEYDGSHHAMSNQRSRDHRKDTLVLEELGLSICRLNSVDLRHPRSQLARNVQSRRQRAIDQGHALRAVRLVHDGILVEQPLRSYPQAS